MSRQRGLWALLAGMALLVACRPDSAPETVEAEPPRPTEAVVRLIDDLHRNDFNAYARHAVPPELHARLETAWSEGRTLWPLTLLPLDEQLPALIAALAAPEAEKELMAVYDRQFAGAERDLRTAASGLGLFAAQYISNEEEFSDEEREHYLQLVAAIGHWGQRAPLADRKRARPALVQLVEAARQTGLAPKDAFRRAGMEHGLTRVGPFVGQLKQVLAGYGLDLDAALAGAEVHLVEQTGDRARVRLQYSLAGEAIDTVLRLERRDGHWYPSDLLQHAEVEAGPVASETDPVTPDATPDEVGGSEAERAEAAG